MNELSFNLDPESKTPMYIQLRDRLASEIASGMIRSGERLPGKRTAARLLGVSISTVDGAYQALVSEGYITAHPRSGFRVEPIEPIPQTFSGTSPKPPEPEDDEPIYSFLTGSIDGSLFPFRTWSRLFKDTLYNRPDLLNHGDPRGDLELRQAIALYLHRSRGVVCGPESIIIGAGMEYLLGLLCHMLKGLSVAVEDPGYPKIHQILTTGGMDVSFVPLDSRGMSPDALEASNADVVYLTPGHQFPTGLVMPAGRRSRLINWASRGGRYIIEDDYDSEFRFDGRPMPCMQALSPDRVIYVGTFSRTVAPAVRVAYMVLPPELSQVYDSRFSFFSSTVSRFEQQALFRYMDEGHFGRSLSRARNRYRMRRDTLTSELRRVFGEACRLENTHTGLSFLFYPHTDKPEPEISASARKLGLAVRGLDSYRFGGSRSRAPALVLGFGSLDEKSIPTAVEMLKQALI